MEFIENHQPVFILILTILAVAAVGLLVVAVIWIKKIISDLVTNRFRIVELNERAENDREALFTMVVSNHAMNAVSLISIGFCHRGLYYNFYETCKEQMRMQNSNLSLLPRSNVKLQVTKEELEALLLADLHDARFGKLEGYIIGSAGETYRAKLKVIRKFVAQDYKIARERKIRELKREGGELREYSRFARTRHAFEVKKTEVAEPPKAPEKEEPAAARPAAPAEPPETRTSAPFDAAPTTAAEQTAEPAPKPEEPLE